MIEIDLTNYFDDVGQEALFESLGPSDPTNTSGTLPNWTEVLTTICVLNELSGNEVALMDQISVEADLKCYIEYTNLITNKHRVTINSKIYNVNYIRNPIGANTYLILFLKESVANDN